MTVDRDRLVAALRPVVDRAGYDLEDLEVAGAGRRTVLRVVVDRDGGFGLDDVADLSRDVSALLDDADELLPGAYVLEVSSPGVDRPLTHPRHWRRNVDRLVEVRLSDGETIRGRIQTPGQHGVVLDLEPGSRDIAFDAIALAKVQIELRPRKTAAGAQPADDDLEDLDDLDDVDLDDVDLDGADVDDEDLGDADPDDADSDADADEPDLNESELDGSKLDHVTRER